MEAMSRMIAGKTLKTKRPMIKCKTMVVEEEEMETIMGECVKSSNVPKITNQPLESEADPIVEAQETKMKYSHS